MKIKDDEGNILTFSNWKQCAKWLHRIAFKSNLIEVKNENRNKK